MPATYLAASRHAPFQLENLPNEAVELIAKHASIPSTPAACLLPLVCRGWRDAADRAELSVDISLDLALAYSCPYDSPDQYELQSSMLGTAAAAAAAAVAAIPTGLLRAGRLAAWLAKYSRNVRSLCIPAAGLCLTLGPAWGAHMRSICQALTAGPGAGPGVQMPHLVQLELPILDLHSTGAFLEALGYHCPSLQHLVLNKSSWDGYKEGPRRDHWDWEGVRKDLLNRPSYMDEIARGVAPLTCLRVLHVEWPVVFPGCNSMAGLLRALPATLEDLYLAGAGMMMNISLSCITHLINLRCWEQPALGLVLDDSNSSGGGSSSSSSGSGSSGAAALTALTRLVTSDVLWSHDARLQLPGLLVLESPYLVPPSWQQLQGMKHLRQLTAASLDVQRGAVDGALLPDVDGAAGLGGMTQLQHLMLARECDDAHRQHRGLLSVSVPWAAAVAKLTQLTALELCEHVLVAGASAMLAPLTQLRTLTVDCTYWLPPGYYPADAEGWAATPAVAVVQAVAAAVQGGTGQLQHLTLMVPERYQPFCGDQAAQLTWQQGAHVQQVQLAAKASLPGLVVQVQPS